jgi:hypothetical protein
MGEGGGGGGTGVRGACVNRGNVCARLRGGLAERAHLDPVQRDSRLPPVRARLPTPVRAGLSNRVRDRVVQNFFEGGTDSGPGMSAGLD